MPRRNPIDCTGSRKRCHQFDSQRGGSARGTCLQACIMRLIATTKEVLQATKEDRRAMVPSNFDIQNSRQAFTKL
eukprot:2587824-Amphidinium_carterae.1